MIFDAAALDWPVRDRDPDYAKILAPLLVEAVANAEGDFVSAVKSVMRTRIGAGSLTRDSVCRALGLNARTLAHRLEAFGVTFSGLADEVRFDAAQSLLLKDRRIGEIAIELGFAEPGAFIRAFRTWSGTTPGRWRTARNGPSYAIAVGSSSGPWARFETQRCAEINDGDLRDPASCSASAN